MKVLVTGGAGFIGSHLVEFLLGQGHQVRVFDNFSTGKREHLKKAEQNTQFSLMEGDICDSSAVDRAVASQDFVFHLCDNSDIRFAAEHTRDYINQNILGGFHVLEAMKKHGVKKIAFPSSTTVLGDATVVPSPESYGPLQPMNLYGGAKLAMEGLLSAYAHTFDMQTWIFRFVDIIGGRIDHGVIHDFIKKLRKNPAELEILGDGSQRRSFLLIDDCVRAIWQSIENFKQPVNLVHIGNGDQIDITTVGHLVAETLGLKDVAFRYTGGKKGWRGDSFTNFIQSNSLTPLGWKAELDSTGAVREAARRLSKAI
jgi:UDP-glucose 4-epimerase